MDNASARVTGIALAVWLLISTALWHHSHAHLINTLIVGLVVGTSSGIAFKIDGFRLVASAAGVWLIASLFAWPASFALSTWHDFMVGLAIILVSSLGGQRRETTPPNRTLRTSD